MREYKHECKNEYKDEYKDEYKHECGKAAGYNWLQNIRELPGTAGNQNQSNKGGRSCPAIVGSWNLINSSFI